MKHWLLKSIHFAPCKVSISLRRNWQINFSRSYIVVQIFEKPRQLVLRFCSFKLTRFEVSENFCADRPEKESITNNQRWRRAFHYLKVCEQPWFSCYTRWKFFGTKNSVLDNTDSFWYTMTLASILCFFSHFLITSISWSK